MNLETKGIFCQRCKKKNLVKADDDIPIKGQKCAFCDVQIT